MSTVEITYNLGRQDAFLLEEYRALRAEMGQQEERISRVMSLGVTGIPALMGIAYQYNVKAVLPASPLIVIVITLLILYYQSSVMRIGSYIRSIENNFIDLKSLGWEHFLESYTKHRHAEQFLHWATFTVFMVYFFAGSVAGWIEVVEMYGDIAGWVAASVYGILALTGIWVVVRDFPRSTNVEAIKLDLEAETAEAAVEGSSEDAAQMT